MELPDVFTGTTAQCCCSAVRWHATVWSFLLYLINQVYLFFPTTYLKFENITGENRENATSNSLSLHLACQAFSSLGFCTSKMSMIAQLNGNRMKGQFFKGILSIWVSELSLQSWVCFPDSRRPASKWDLKQPICEAGAALYDEGWCAEKKCVLITATWRAYVPKAVVIVSVPALLWMFLFRVQVC